MSRRTKRKSANYGVTPLGQIVRLDTILGDPDKYLEANHFKHAEAVQPELDLDTTRSHREELRSTAEPEIPLLSQPTKVVRQAG